MNPQDNISTQDPLAQLQDIHLPSSIGIWPPALGWWLLLAITMLVIAAIIFLVRRQKLRNGYRQLALQELQKIQQQFTAEQRSEYLQAISILLRRTALSGFGTKFNPSLKGNEWLQWLDEQSSQSHHRFNTDVGRALLIGPYQKNPDIDRAQLHKIVESWIQHHRNQWQQKNKKLIAVTKEAQQNV